jgi:hypothetical protein
LRWRQFEACFQRSYPRVCERGKVFRRKLWLVHPGILEWLRRFGQTLDVRLGQARSAAVAAIRTCFFMRFLELAEGKTSFVRNALEKQFNLS